MSTEEMEFEEFYCPEGGGEWVSCPGPCPDGTPHSPRRTVVLTVDRDTRWVVGRRVVEDSDA